MKPGKKTTLFGFAGIVLMVFIIMKAGEYQHVAKREAEYKPCKRKYEYVVDADHVVNCHGDTIKYDWQIIKRK